MTRDIVLADLLVSLFSPGELRRLLRSYGFADVEERVPTDASPRTTADTVARIVATQPDLVIRLFVVLRAERPGRVVDIDSAQRRMATAPAASSTPAADRALRDVIAERQKQRAKWGDAHDDGHTNPCALPLAAAVLAAAEEPGVGWRLLDDSPEWVRDLVRRHGARERRIIAAALLLAEVERIDRAAAKTTE